MCKRLGWAQRRVYDSSSEFLPSSMSFVIVFTKWINILSEKLSKTETHHKTWTHWTTVSQWRRKGREEEEGEGQKNNAQCSQSKMKLGSWKLRFSESYRRNVIRNKRHVERSNNFVSWIEMVQRKFLEVTEQKRHEKKLWIQST